MRKSWQFNYPMPEGLHTTINNIVKTVSPNNVTLILHYEKKKHISSNIVIKNCVICGKLIQQGEATGYVFTEKGKSILTLFPFCSAKCANKFVMEFFNPIFENWNALELFKVKHPRLWKQNRKPTIVLSNVKQENCLVPAELKEHPSTKTDKEKSK